MFKKGRNAEEPGAASGSLKISTDVIASVAKIAASEVSGVMEVIDNQSSKDSQSSGLKVRIRGNEASFDISIKIGHGVAVPKVASDIQTNVKNAVESMTGMVVKQVNVIVEGVCEEQQED